MNAYLNYLLEASIGLCLFLLVYQLLLSKETSFRLNRIFLLLAIIASLTFPLFTIDTADSPVPSLNLSVEPETVHYTPTPASDPIPEPAALSTWQIIGIVYAAGLFVFLIVFVIRLTGIVKALKRSFKYTYRNHNIVELKGEHSPFSFFNYIFISSASPLSEKEKQQIIEHEGIHARLYHSIDILLINALGILFWFNPVIRIYKKIFVQLHEFEADARAVEQHDVNEYSPTILVIP
jgi:beta-lactamase regulating signal transducer with metallopeptidase domain